jgi:poly-gamma-glutamate capsule biosynthesis protein CapA/YwtB (metallophosphatase superfamily)
MATKKRMWFITFISLLLTILILFSIYLCVFKSAKSNSVASTTQGTFSPLDVTSSVTTAAAITSGSSITTVANPSTTTEILISAVGDCTLGMDYNLGYWGSFLEEYDNQKKSTSYFLTNVKDTFFNDDLSIANLETTLTTATKQADKKFRHRGLPEFASILTDGGIDAVNIANNHTFDFFKQGFVDTLSNLKKKDIGYFGYGNKLIKEVKGVKVGLLGYTALFNLTQDKKDIKKDIKDLKEKGARIVIVSFHVGKEKEYYPCYTQKEYSRFAINSGADLVLGHHPHVLQAIENYKGKYIVYSLGNFCYGGSNNPSDKDTIIFQQKFTLDNTKDNTKIISTEINIIPCSISSVKTRNNYQPTPLLGTEKERVIKKINELSLDFNFQYKQK